MLYSPLENIVLRIRYNKLYLPQDHVHVQQWCSQTRTHTGLGPGVSNAKVLRQYCDAPLYRSTVAVLSVCSGLQYSLFPDTILSGNEDYACPLILGSLVLRLWSALLPWT